MSDIIVDVDTGIDDALALIFLARSPLLRLRAVTCVSGNTSVTQATRNTLGVLDAAGRGEVPVAAGAARPLIAPVRSAAGFHGQRGMAGFEPESAADPAGVHAVELMRSVIESSPEPVTLLALGPLTNVALLIRMYPEVAAALKHVVFMGGSTTVGNATPVAEFNIWHDPEAAAILFGAGLSLTMYGLDVFYDVAVKREDYGSLIEAEDHAQALAGELLRYSDEQAVGDPRFAEGGLLGDAGAACLVALPDLGRIELHPLSVVLEPGPARGQTIVDRRTRPGEQEDHGLHSAQSPASIVVGVDEERMVAHYLETVRGAQA